MLADVLIPIGELFLEVKDRLHRIAKNAGRECRRHIVDDRMLRDIAVLIFINEQTTVSSGESGTAPDSTCSWRTSNMNQSDSRGTRKNVPFRMFKIEHSEKRNG